MEDVRVFQTLLGFPSLAPSVRGENSLSSRLSDFFRVASVEHKFPEGTLRKRVPYLGLATLVQLFEFE